MNKRALKTDMVELDIGKLPVKAEPLNSWIEFLTKYNDIFGRDYVGYWLFGVARDKKLGWLAYEFIDDEASYMSKNYDEVIAAWKRGEKLPEKYFVLNEETARRAYVEGIKRKGVEWYEQGDANDYDVVLQWTLLGEVRYG
jgi:hypothetical protein